MDGDFYFSVPNLISSPMETTNRGIRSKNLIIKTWERCKSMGKSSSEGNRNSQSPKPKSSKRNRVSPEGYFSVYVGVGKVKYVVRTECLNHPLFKTLLDEAEMEYGYAVNGPLELPCDVDHFENVLMEVENGGDYYDEFDGGGLLAYQFDNFSVRLDRPWSIGTNEP